MAWYIFSKYKIGIEREREQYFFHRSSTLSLTLCVNLYLRPPWQNTVFKTLIQTMYLDIPVIKRSDPVVHTFSASVTCPLKGGLTEWCKYVHQ